MRIPVDEARQRIVALAGSRRGSVDEVALDRALDRVIAIDVVAPHAIPPFPNSAMDGYALRGADLPRDGEKRFRIRGAMLAGAGTAIDVDTDECVRITTGAPLPRGADTVVIKENARAEGGFAAIGPGEKAGANVRPAGEELSDGELAVRAGEVLNAARLGVLASCGFSRVPVARRPRVALFATGDELVAPDKPLGFGQVHDSNRFSVGGLLEGLGIVAQPCAHLRDDVPALREALAGAAAVSDVVITCGGVSAGEADHIPRLLAELGRIHFWKVRMKPGMPFLCGEIGKALVFGLPGNPLSSLATFHALVEPGLMAMQGAVMAPVRWRAHLVEPFAKTHDRTTFLCAFVDCDETGQLRARLLDRQGSGMLRGAADANALVVVDEDVRELAAGDVVDVLPLRGMA
ncbi:MAG TPA: gephyrin-like molybdotransferase Glp [Rhodanobacteraceae bacterium]|nr:gephyrin-like molybdotransferase Glp [Rhodanobacteraceae bacterium]